jgi:heme oxygenase
MIPSILDPFSTQPEYMSNDSVTEVNIHPQITPSEYSENIYGKAQEIQNIRKALHLSQEKVLWEVLDKGRQGSHIKVRKNHFLQQLTTGGFCHTAFMKYLVNLLHLHMALEDAQKIINNIEHLKPFVHDDLFRSQSIKRDLQIWEFVASQEFVPWQPSKITLEYANYIRETAINDPEKIIAIMYTLYGTIMSGGQTNKKIVHQALANIRTYMDEVPEGSGVALYEIGKDRIFNDEEIAKFKINWHESLCRVQSTLPFGTSVEDFHVKLTNEVTKTFETFLEIIKDDVENGHC